MTEATRNALERVSQIPHEAGWDSPSPEPLELTDKAIQTMRNVYTNLLRDDFLAIINETLGKGQRVEDAGRVLGKGPDESKALLAEALMRLVDFAEIAEEQGFAPNTSCPIQTRSDF